VGVITPAHWLVDKSALRPQVPEFADVLIPRIAAGRVAMCLVTELEVGFSARSTKYFELTRDDVIGPLISVGMPYRAEDRAREIQTELVARGQHRAVAIPDLIVAAIADVEGLTVLHYDSDFDIIAAITGQPTEWVVARGTV
jgi:predicted nucleic acid-binding protein